MSWVFDSTLDSGYLPTAFTINEQPDNFFFLVKSHNIPSLLIRITCIWKRISQLSKKMILLIHRDSINMPLMLDLLHSAPLCYIYYILVYVWAHVCRLSGSVGMALDFMIHIEYPCHSSCFLLLLFSQVLHHISLFIWHQICFRKLDFLTSRIWKYYIFIKIKSEAFKSCMYIDLCTFLEEKYIFWYTLFLTTDWYMLVSWF